MSTTFSMAPERTPGPSAKPKEVDARQFASLVNLSGRQRMLSQRVVLHAVLASAGREDALAAGIKALGLFEESQHSLSDSPMTGLVANRWKDHAGHTQRVDHFIALARRVFDGIGRNQAIDASLDELIGMVSPILESLNTVTATIETIAREHGEARRKHLNDVMTKIGRIALEAHMVSLNARIIASRAGSGGQEFAVVARVLTEISEQIGTLAKSASEDAA